MQLIGSDDGNYLIETEPGKWVKTDLNTQKAEVKIDGEIITVIQDGRPVVDPEFVVIRERGK